MPTLADLRADVPRWAEYFASEDVSNAFEGMTTVGGQEHLLAVAPPIRLHMGSFTEEELRSDRIGELHQMESEKMRDGACRTEEGEAAPPPRAQEIHLSWLTDEEMDEYLR